MTSVDEPNESNEHGAREAPDARGRLGDRDASGGSSVREETGERRQRGGDGVRGARDATGVRNGRVERGERGERDEGDESGERDEVGESGAPVASSVRGGSSARDGYASHQEPGGDSGNGGDSGHGGNSGSSENGARHGDEGLPTSDGNRHARDRSPGGAGRAAGGVGRPAGGGDPTPGGADPYAADRKPDEHVDAADPADDGYPAARLRLLTEGGQPGPARRATLAGLTDAWLDRLFTTAAAGLPGVSLVAVGGYGRGELSPRSDLDLLLLYDTRADPAAVAALADRIWYPVWDLGLALDHSVRTPAEAHRTVGGDLKVHLGLLDARHLAGDPRLTAELRAAVLADWRNQAAKRLPELRELCAERAARQGELRYLLEPDLKEARGGLRDATALRAVAASWLADAPREGLAEARRTLLDTRDVLHLVTGRATDRLSLQEQDQVAADLGLPDADALLRTVYEAARTVSYASDVTWREVGRVLRARSGRPRLRGVLARGGFGRGGGAQPQRSPLAEGVVEQDGETVLARTARPEHDPVLPLRAAAAAAQAGLPLSPHAVRRLAATTRPLPTPWPAEARDRLVALLGAGRPTVDVWEALDAEGMISRLLPDWEWVRCRPQRNAVHTWTVDRHLVETAVRAAALTRRVGRPDLLLVAALLHDIGKGRPGDHCEAGAELAARIAAGTGFDAADTAVITTLVRHHLLLVETATRRDLDDPATVRTITDAVGSTGTLELLHALTEADALATGPAAWSTWRAGLVADLVARAAGALSGRAPGVPEPSAPTAEQERLAMEALSTGGPVLRLRARPEDGDGGRGAGTTGGRGAADRTSPAGSAAAPGEPEPLGAELLVAVPEQPGVLPAVAGVLALHRLTVRTAELRVGEPPDDLADGRPGPQRGAPGDGGRGLGGRGDGGPIAAGGPLAAGRDGARLPGAVLLLDWRVAAEYGSLPQATRLRADLVRALDGTLDIAGRLAERDAAYPRRRGSTPPPPKVTVAPAGSRRATVIEVRAQDAPGLLHRVGRALDAAGVRVRSAHVSTLGANAVDAFYVTDPDDRPLGAERAGAVARALEAVLRA